MKSLRFLDRRAGYSLASLGILLGVVAPAALPTLASAGNLTSRSVTMTSPVADATGVGYTVQFTAASAIGASGGFVMQFCDSSSGPLVGEDCVEPAGMSVASLSGVNAKIDTGSGFVAASSNGTLTSADETTAGTSNDGYVKWVSGGDTLAIGDKLKVSFTGVTNQSATGTFYARIYTYNGAPNFTNSTTGVGTTADTGSVALSTSAGVGVTAYVQESMTFCVANIAPSPGCTGISYPTNSPSMTIGQTVGSSKVLSTSVVSSGTDYLQLSTNAANGAVVNLKSDATTCGGLKLVGGTGCIPGQATSGADLVANTPGFGIELGTAADASGATNTTGTIVNATATNAHYVTNKYYLDSTDDDTAGVTTAYGSPFVDTAGAPVSNKNLSFTLGAIIGNQTPAGKYSASLNMIAVGTF